MKLKELIQYLENKFPLRSQADFDNCGLLIGDDQEEIKSVLISLDCTEEIIEEAIEIGSNVIISHHPVIFKGIKKLTGSTYVERTLLKAIKHNIAIYAIHTNLDHHIEGVNREICNRLDLTQVKILSPNSVNLYKLHVFVPQDYISQVGKALFEAGAGRIGNYNECSFVGTGIGSFTPLENANPFTGNIGSRNITEENKIEVLVNQNDLSNVLLAMKEAHPYEVVAHDVYRLENKNQEEGSGMIGKLAHPVDSFTFLANLKQKFHCGSIRHTEIHTDTIQRVAVCGGSGSFLLQQAKSQQADIFITSDFKYHEFFDAENEIIIADIGHYESEQFTINLLHREISKKFTNFAIQLTGINTNPINYF